ncbi:ATP-dependent DNA helicase chl1 [Coemansia sp. RSA 989]|nr:ATP-dependent DNA helicase chl1 [Coemansia sp. RSA 989]KAJ2672834.1 ATP-dependent DNA helicase chl1 [Coemansia sp. RSA 1085]
MTELDASNEQPLPTPQAAEEFGFPISTPYDIQIEFMQRLFETLEKGDFGIFESPTGTGKSLSIICGALTWLTRHLNRPTEATPQKSTSDNKPDWVLSYENKLRENDDPTKAAAERYKAWELKVRREEAAIQQEKRRAARRVGAVSRKPTGHKRNASDGNNSDEDLIVDYGSDNELTDADQAQKLLAAYNSDSDEEDGKIPEEPSITKIIYASRTHSQLQQFVSEIKRTRFGKTIKCVVLGSRAQLCTNTAVRKACGSVQALNEKCTEMQQQKGTRCPQLPVQHLPMLDFKQAMQKVADIEDTVTEAQQRGVCAYYGARSCVRQAHVVALPYNMLLTQGARDALGVQLEGNVVIVDEAHNLVDTILASHSALLSQHTVALLLDLLQRYFKRFWQRLRGSNVVYIRQTIALLRALHKHLQAHAQATTDDVLVRGVNQFLHEARADHINVFKIDRYLKESKIGRKLNMFADRSTGTPGDDNKRTCMGSQTTHAHVDSASSSSVAPATAVAALETFIGCIGSPDRTGARVVVRRQQNPQNGEKYAEITYVLMDPSEAFGELRRQARAVVLAGGTMTPAADIVEQLLPKFGRLSRSDCTVRELHKLDPDNVRLFAWPHVVAPSHICAMVVEAGPTNTPLRFTFQDQQKQTSFRESGWALASLCNVVPGGVVVFFPSYSLLSRMLQEWRLCGIVERISKRKTLIAESTGNDGSSQDVLAKYVECVRKPGSLGAVLLSVVGGRLSEGINFSDDLGRAVVMIGLPFPSLASPELNERLAYYESIGKYQEQQSKSSDGSLAAAASKSHSMGPRARQLYESLCMRAVNQSIGRAIRHRGDYAAIVFFDLRYAESRISTKLPSWITGSHADQPVKRFKFGPAMAQIASFFKQDFKAL